MLVFFLKKHFLSITISSTLTLLLIEIYVSLTITYLQSVDTFISLNKRASDKENVRKKILIVIRSRS